MIEPPIHSIGDILNLAKRKPKRDSNGCGEKSDDGFVRGQNDEILRGHPENIRRACTLLGIALHHNAFLMLTEITEGNTRSELTDAKAIRLRFLIQEMFGFLPSKQLFEDVLTDIAHQNSYHPVRDYLDGLKWDGVPRIDNWLPVYAGAEDTPFNRSVGRIFLVAGVRRIRQPGAKYDTMLVFESGQGKDKSKALRALATKDEWFTDNLPLSADPKEVIEATCGVWIAEFAELDGISRRDVGHVKSFLSKQDDRARPAYGRRSERIPRQFVPAGSTNDAQYLLDIENRRFWPVSIKKFDTEKLKRDVDQLWAEAAHYEAEGESITLQEDLWAAAAEAQEQREVDSPILDALRTIVRGKDWISAALLWETLGTPLERRSSMVTAVGKAMRKLNFERKQVWDDQTKAELKRGDPYYARRPASEC